MLTLSQLLPHHARYRSHYHALSFQDQDFTYAALNARVNQLANALLAAGLKKGDCFATVLPNCVELMLAYWAAAASGLVIVPCSHLLTASGLTTLLRDSGCRLVIADQSQIDTLAALSSNQDMVALQHFIVTDASADAGFVSWDTFIANASSNNLDADVKPDDIFNIMYSSGTTGRPKGIIHSHHIRSLYCTLFANSWRMTPESVVLHAGAIVFNGAMLTLMPWMYLGCNYILHPRFEADKVIEDIEKHAVTHLVMVPAQIIAILNSPHFTAARLASVEMLHNVGAPLHLSYKNSINALLPNRFYELYGVTEGFMTILDRTEAVAKASSVGKPAAFTEVCILDQRNQFCKAGEIGEICGRWPLLMPGYHNQPELTAKAFINGWLRSGDLGYLDHNGYLFVVDRKKDMIISGGVNVYPKDIEDIMIQHPAVDEVAVFAIADHKWGEVPVAAVKVNATLCPEALIHWVNQRVDARFQRIANALIVDEFPRNAAGKILKRELQANYSGANNRTSH